MVGKEVGSVRGRFIFWKLALAASWDVVVM